MDQLGLPLAEQGNELVAFGSFVSKAFGIKSLSLSPSASKLVASLPFTTSYLSFLRLTLPGLERQTNTYTSPSTCLRLRWECLAPLIRSLASLVLCLFLEICCEFSSEDCIYGMRRCLSGACMPFQPYHTALVTCWRFFCCDAAGTMPIRPAKAITIAHIWGFIVHQTQLVGKIPTGCCCLDWKDVNVMTQLQISSFTWGRTCSL